MRQYLTDVLQVDRLKQAQEDEHNDAKVVSHLFPLNPVIIIRYVLRIFNAKTSKIDSERLNFLLIGN